MLRKAKDKVEDARDRVRIRLDKSEPPDLSDAKQRQEFIDRLVQGKVSTKEAKYAMPYVWRMNQSNQSEIRERAQNLFSLICKFTPYQVTPGDWSAMKRPDPPNFHKGKTPYDDRYQVSTPPDLGAPVSATQHGRPYAPDSESSRRPVGPRRETVEPVKQGPGKIPSR